MVFLILVVCRFKLSLEGVLEWNGTICRFVREVWEGSSRSLLFLFFHCKPNTVVAFNIVSDGEDSAVVCGLLSSLNRLGSSPQWENQFLHDSCDVE